MNKQIKPWFWLGIVGLWLGGPTPKTLATPGEPIPQVINWIRAHPNLPAPQRNPLRTFQSNTPAQRFTFEASTTAPGTFRGMVGSNLIRSERLSFFDMVNGVTRDRLERALRLIYNPEVMMDFQGSTLVYGYPTEAMLEFARRRNLPLLAAQEGELRAGKKFAYWLEIVHTEQGIAYNGEITVFLKEDLITVEQFLRNR